MDDYGCMKPCAEDAEAIRLTLAQAGSAVFALSGDSIGCMIILICTQFEKMGVMPFGGNPVGRAFVGVYGRGCNHFSMDSIEPGYFEEKLKIAREEAEWLSDLWGKIWEKK